MLPMSTDNLPNNLLPLTFTSKVEAQNYQYNSEK